MTVILHWLAPLLTYIRELCISVSSQLSQRSFHPAASEGAALDLSRHAHCAFLCLGSIHVLLHLTMYSKHFQTALKGICSDQLDCPACNANVRYRKYPAYSRNLKKNLFSLQELMAGLKRSVSREGMLT